VSRACCSSNPVCGAPHNRVGRNRAVSELVDAGHPLRLHERQPV
jgi:hypothetical protein